MIIINIIINKNNGIKSYQNRQNKNNIKNKNKRK